MDFARLQRQRHIVVRAQVAEHFRNVLRFEKEAARSVLVHPVDAPHTMT